MKKNNKKDQFEYVGQVTVDAGLIRVGDPCYSFKNHNKWIKWLTKHLEFNKGQRTKDTYIIPHEKGQDWARENDGAKSIVVQSGFGDGCYPVFVDRCSETGTIKSLYIEFFE